MLKALGVRYNVAMVRCGGPGAARALGAEMGVGFAASLVRCLGVVFVAKLTAGLGAEFGAIIADSLRGGASQQAAR